MTTQIPAIEGWFTGDALLGTKCAGCGCYFFPPERTLCRNPACVSTDLEEIELSKRGKVWSFSVNHYAAPAPYVGKEPFEPYTVVAVELVTEQMVVLGQLAEGVDPASLKIGQEVEVVIEPLFSNDDGEHIVWKWRPVR
ncbi:MAG: OB-fold domain-containing protein [Actinomycetota bacterium]